MSNVYSISRCREFTGWSVHLIHPPSYETIVRTSGCLPAIRAILRCGCGSIGRALGAASVGLAAWGFCDLVLYAIHHISP